MTKLNEVAKITPYLTLFTEEAPGYCGSTTNNRQVRVHLVCGELWRDRRQESRAAADLSSKDR